MKKLSLAAALVLCAVLLGSCLDFFTNSWGKEMARDPGTITVTSKNVNALLKESRGDPAASRGILDKIAAELKGNPNPDPTLQAAAITAANQAAGLGELVLGSINTVLEDPDNADFDELLKKIEDETKGKELDKISTNVTDSLSSAVTTGTNGPVLTGAFVDSVSDGDLALLAMTLVMGELGNEDFETYIDTWGDSGKKLDGSGNTLTDSEKLIAAIANTLASRPNSTIGGQLNELFN
jgi:hypothetical protein